MDRSAIERRQPDAASEVECLREAAALGASAPLSTAMPVPEDSSHSQRRTARRVQALESEVVPRLVQVHRPSVPEAAPAALAPWRG